MEITDEKYWSVIRLQYLWYEPLETLVDSQDSVNNDQGSISYLQARQSIDSIVREQHHVHKMLLGLVGIAQDHVGLVG